MIDDGGHAFPGQGLGQDGLPSHEPFFGMSLRDYFAGQILPVILKGSLSDSEVAKALMTMDGTADPGEAMAIAAYRIADSMIKVRDHE